MAYGQTLVSTLLPRRRVRRLPAKDWRPFLNLQRTEKAKNPLAFASGLTGAADEARPRYLHLGKVALYQMSYGRIFGAFVPAPSRAILANFGAPAKICEAKFCGEEEEFQSLLRRSYL